MSNFKLFCCQKSYYNIWLLKNFRQPMLAFIRLILFQGKKKHHLFPVEPCQIYTWLKWHFATLSSVIHWLSSGPPHTCLKDLLLTILSFFMRHISVFKDKHTKSPFVEDYRPLGDDGEGQRAAKPDHIYLDAMGFGMGCSCLQVTFQACNITEARHLYDQLTPLCPILVSMCFLLV